MNREQAAYYRLLEAAGDYLRTMGFDSMIFGRPEIKHGVTIDTYSHELTIKFTPGDKL